MEEPKNIKQEIELYISDIARTQKMVADFEATEAYKDYTAAKKHIRAVDNVVRDSALDCYHQTGQKLLHPAVSLQMRNTFEYDAEQAIEYALNVARKGNTTLVTIANISMSTAISCLVDQFPHVLILNDKEFIKELKSSPDLPGFVSESKEPFVKIAKDLSEFGE